MSTVPPADLQGAVAVVTGASSGIGEAVAAALSEAGCRVHGFDLQAPRAPLPDVRHHAVDVCSDASVEAAVAEVLAQGEPVRVLVNCAGVIAKQGVSELDFDTWDRVQEVNVKGTIRTIRALRDSLVASGRGRVVNISSMTANLGVETYAPYSASKAAVSNLTRAFAAELATAGVTVNALCPGWVDTPMGRAGLVAHIARLHGIDEAEAVEKILSYVPQHRFIDPREIGHAVVSLAHPLAQAITAEEIRIDCGLTQMFSPGLHSR